MNVGLGWRLLLSVVFAGTVLAHLRWTVSSRGWAPRLGHALHLLMGLAMVLMWWPGLVTVPFGASAAVFGAGCVFYLARAWSAPGGLPATSHDWRPALGYHAVMMASMVWMAWLMAAPMTAPMTAPAVGQVRGAGAGSMSGSMGQSMAAPLAGTMPASGAEGVWATASAMAGRAGEAGVVLNAALVLVFVVAAGLYNAGWWRLRATRGVHQGVLAVSAVMAAGMGVSFLLML